MEHPNVVQVTPDNWQDVADRINWRTPEMIDRTGDRFVQDITGDTTYRIPFDVWYETKAYNRVWRRFYYRSSGN